MPFLDVDKKVWVIKDLKLPVIEDLPMTDLDWFTNKLIEAEAEANDGKTGTKEEIEFEESWFNKICELGLGKTKADIAATRISKPDFRALMAEVYAFLSICGTVEGAKQSGLYEVKIPNKEK